MFVQNADKVEGLIISSSALFSLYCATVLVLLMEKFENHLILAFNHLIHIASIIHVFHSEVCCKLSMSRRKCFRAQNLLPIEKNLKTKHHPNPQLNAT